ncbi:MAG: type I DNA topoisomerase [Elusimicrobia bacterium]|nr:type I DNA topoisomerase [Elusimicrobiota bacterium]
MAKNLVIVESPTKQKTISKFLDSSYMIRSSFGHIRDLPQNDLGVDVKSGFKPTYVLVERGKKIISELDKIAKSADKIYLATDPDREGEAISWHLTEALKSADKSKFKRISFHEITKNAILEALKTPRDLDFNLVNAQQARRILDRLVGYQISPLLWAKIKKGLSAGRVQSVAVRLISERALEIESFKESDYYTIDGIFEKGGVKFPAKMIKWKGKNIEETVLLKLFAEDYKYKTSCFKTLEETAELISALKDCSFYVSSVERKTVSQKPKPPFITSSLQQDSYTRLGFTPERTMRIAQSLYEGVNIAGEMTGLITYMRTDSFNVSDDMRKKAADFIKKNYGQDYAPKDPPVYLKKVKGAQEAHESIHPTDINRKPADIKDFLSAEQYKLYDLIWKRFMASQMSPALFDSVSIEIKDDKDLSLFRTSGRTLKFEGYLKVYQESEKEEDEEEEEKSIPPIEEKDSLNLKDAQPKPHRTSPPAHYNEASLIKTLEKHGIGRPSTYASIISTIVERGYVKREKDKRLTITELGKIVTEKLKMFFKDIMSLSYTAQIEDKLDDIADGAVSWEKIISQFYSEFSKNLENASKNMGAAKMAVKTSEKCPLCLSPMLLRESRFGKYLSCSRFPKCQGKIQLDAQGNKIEKFNAVKTDKKCSKCKKGNMLLRKGPRGFFLGCSRFPSCRNIESLKDEEAAKIISENRGK